VARNKTADAERKRVHLIHFFRTAVQNTQNQQSLSMYLLIRDDRTISTGKSEGSMKRILPAIFHLLLLPVQV
jgi:hypothetical protein